MNEDPSTSGPSESNGMIDAIRKRRERRKAWLTEGETSLLRFAGQIGVLGWMIVTPTLIGLFIGHLIDRKLGTGIFWSAPLLMLGVVAGSWSAWRWMHKQ